MSTYANRSNRKYLHLKASFQPRNLRLRLLIGVLVVLFSVASLALWANLTSAQSSQGGTGYRESEVSLPKVLGEPHSVRVAPALGFVSDGIPIVVPPGRRNVQPNLTLAYGSMSGLGDIGLGWDLGIGQVTRWRGDGTPTVANEEMFSYSISGAGGQLLHTEGGLYRARVESTYREFRRIGDQPDAGWVMQTGEGVLHRFGGTPESRIEDSGGRGQVWLLDLVQDRSGNTICYFYERVNGALYPKEIRYTGWVSSSEEACQPAADLGANQIVFAYDEDRPDKRIIYNSTVREQHTRRLQTISVFAGEELVRRYSFQYEQSTLNGQSLLRRIVLIGADDVSQIVLRTLEYGTRAVGWSGETVSGTIPLALVSDGLESGVRLLDVNGDGRADVVGNGQEVYLGDGQGNFAYDTQWSESLAYANVRFIQPDGDYKGADTGVRLADVNTDGRPDLFIAQTSRREVWLNTGFGWSLDGQWTASLETLRPSAAVDPNYTDLAPPDFAPEEILDLASFANLLWEHSDGVSIFLWDRFDEDTQQLIDDYINEIDPEQQALLADDLRDALVSELNQVVNGDLIYDEDRFAQVELSESAELLLAQSPEGEWLHRLNRLLLEDAYPGILANCLVPPIYSQLEENYAGEPLALVEDDGVPKGVELADVNADGRLDILWAMDRSDKVFWGRQEIPIVLRAAFLNTGQGWIRNSTLTQELAGFSFVQDGQLSGYSMPDVNGDGLADIVRTFDGAQGVHLGTGSGWGEELSFSESLVSNDIVSLKEIDDKRQGQGLTPTDFNDDGLVDYLRANETVTKAYRNTGTGWETEPEMTAILASMGIAFNTADGDATGVTLADVDGDGLADLIKATNGERQIRLSASLRTGLLVRSTSALGEITELTWTPSTSFNNQREDEIEGLPGVMPVATSLTRHDGRGNVYETNYSYRGGLFEGRQFRGFAWSEELHPNGFRKETWYRQEEGLIGSVELEEGIDTQGQLRTRQSTFSEKVGAWPPGCNVDVDCRVTQVRLVESNGQMLDPPVGGWQSCVQYSYDERLQVVEVRKDPNVDLDGDETVTVFSWARNEAEGIWSLTARTQALGAEGDLLTESVILYDGLSEGQADRGLPSEALDLVQPEHYVTKVMGYDKYGNLTRVTDRNGNDTTFEYGEPTRTFRTKATDPEGRVVWSEYDPRFGQLVRDVDMGGNTTLQMYDAFGRLEHVTLPGDEESPNGTVTYTYSALGNATVQFYHLAATENPGQPGTLDTTSYFDGFGLIYRVEQEGAEGRTVVALTEFDDAGNVVASSRPFYSDEPPSWTTTERDDLHRPVRVVEPDEIPITFSYAGQRVDVVDRRGSQSTFYQNTAGQVTEIHQWVDGVEQITHYRYDALGNLTAVIDSLGEETHLMYDALGRRVRLEDPNAGAFDYSYDGEGRPTEQPGPDGQTTYFRYNRAGDLLRKEFPDGTVDEFAYDGAGNLVRVTDAAGVVEMIYDGRGRVIERRRTVLGRTYLTGYTYDSLDRVRSIIYPDGFVINQEYDAGGNLVRLTDSQGQMVAEITGYAASGQILGLTSGNGDRSSFTYDELGRMTSIQTINGDGETLQSLDYAYDPGGNILSIVDSAFGASQDFEYDALGQLKRAVGAYGEEMYDYDAIGNLLRKGSIVFTVDPDHPQRVVRATDLNGDEFELDYDERGNVIEKGSQRFEYDSENHLVRVLKASGQAQGRMLEENGYDSGGQRVIQRTPDDTIIFIDGIYEEGRTHASRHVWAGPLLVATVVTPRATVQLISEIPLGGLAGYLDAMGRWNPSWFALGGLAGLAFLLIPSDGWLRAIAILYTTILNLASVVRWHRWGKVAVLMLVLLVLLCAITPQGVAAQASKEQPHSEKRYYYHSNHLGSTNVVTDDSGKVIVRRDYKPYGEPFNWTSPQSGPRELLQTFNGQRYDDATGLYYFGARHYDSQLGRFLTADTEVTDPLNPKMLNRYAFAGGNPIRYCDPTGHGFWDWFWGIVIAVVLIAIGVFLTIASFGLAGPPIAVGLTVGLAGLGAGAFAVYAVTNGLSPSSTEFWKAVLGGFVIGAAVGAALAALPYAIGFGTTLQGLAASALLGAVFGSIETAVAFIAGGGGPEGLLNELFNVQALVSAGIGAALGGVLFLIGGGSASAAVGKRIAQKVGANSAKQIVARMWPAALSWAIGKTITTRAAKQIIVKGFQLGWASFHGSKFFPDLLDFLGFRNSPPKPVGVPGWVVADTWLGARPDPQASNLAPLLQTMPLAP